MSNQDGRRTRRTNQEIISNGLLGRHAPRILSSSLKHAIASPGTDNVESIIQNTITPPSITVTPGNRAAVGGILAQLQDRRHIAAAIAVIRGGPNGHDAAVKHLLVALHDELVGAGHEGQVVFVVKLLDNVAAKQESRAARAQTPTFNLVRVGPQQIAHGAFVWHFLFSVDQPDFVHRVDERGEPTVDAQDGSCSAGELVSGRVCGSAGPRSWDGASGTSI